MHDGGCAKSRMQQIHKRNVYLAWSVCKAEQTPGNDEEGTMKGIVLAVSAVLLGTLAYITIGIALASVS